jgi:hypothetical protein
MLQQPLRLRVVKRGVEPPTRCQSRRTVTTATEQLRIVAGLTPALLSVGIRGVSLREVGGMKTPRPFPGVAVRTEALFMTSGA